jgi:hypothetical protein
LLRYYQQKLNWTRSTAHLQSKKEYYIMTTIRFTHDAELEGVFPSPVSALKKAPDFFKAIKSQSSNHPASGTVKRCIPFLDALSAGFIIPLWADLYVFAENGNLSLSFPENMPMKKSIESHNYIQMKDHPLSEKPYGKDFMKFLNPWVIETDDGYSCLFTSPLNHLETRIKILDGVVDTDTYYNNVNFPFIWTGGDGEFFIPKGTPLVQVIPFKREEYSVEVGVTDEARRRNVNGVLGTHIKNGYRQEFWSNRKNSPEE